MATSIHISGHAIQLLAAGSLIADTRDLIQRIHDKLMADITCEPIGDARESLCLLDNAAMVSLNNCKTIVETLGGSVAGILEHDDIRAGINEVLAKLKG